MVKLYKQSFGRGPTKVCTNWAGADTLVVSLEHTLTPAERNLVKMMCQPHENTSRAPGWAKSRTAWAVPVE